MAQWVRTLAVKIYQHTRKIQVYTCNPRDTGDTDRQNLGDRRPGSLSVMVSFRL